jgi:hypothetical protein
LSRIRTNVRFGSQKRLFHNRTFYELATVANVRFAPNSGPSLTIIIYVRNIFGLATKEASHPSMMETS